LRGAALHDAFFIDDFDDERGAGSIRHENDAQWE